MPVTASFVIGWVIIGPALLDLGVAAPAAAMFVFYFAVLSEASPPTALAAVAAAAVTGGRVVPTMWQTLRYALPAYLVPIAFVVTPAGLGLLGIGGPGGSSSPGWSPRSVSPCSPSAAGGWLLGVGPAAPRTVLGASPASACSGSNLCPSPSASPWPRPRSAGLFVIAWPQSPVRRRPGNRQSCGRNK